MQLGRGKRRGRVKSSKAIPAVGVSSGGSRRQTRQPASQPSTLTLVSGISLILLCFLAYSDVDLDSRREDLWKRRLRRPPRARHRLSSFEPSQSNLAAALFRRDATVRVRRMSRANAPVPITILPSVAISFLSADR